MISTLHLRAHRGFSRTELAFTTAALGFVVLAATASIRPNSDASTCFNNLRRLGVAVFSYADEHDDTFPPRRSSPGWIGALRSYYKDDAVLRCPADERASSAHSYLENAWLDYFLARSLVVIDAPVPVAAVREPSATIVHGEKVPQSMHLWMDLTQDDFEQVEQGRHFASDPQAGASNYLFADASVRSLKFGAAMRPINLWAIEPEWRSFVVERAEPGRDQP